MIVCQIQNAAMVNASLKQSNLILLVKYLVPPDTKLLTMFIMAKPLTAVATEKIQTKMIFVLPIGLLVKLVLVLHLLAHPILTAQDTQVAHHAVVEYVKVLQIHVHAVVAAIPQSLLQLHQQITILLSLFLQLSSLL